MANTAGATDETKMYSKQTAYMLSVMVASVTVALSGCSMPTSQARDGTLYVPVISSISRRRRPQWHALSGCYMPTPRAALARSLSGYYIIFAAPQATVAICLSGCTVARSKWLLYADTAGHSGTL